MPFPRKFKHLIELERENVELPDEAWLTYAVCVSDEDACGWQGWIIESLARGGNQLNADTGQKCPACDRILFRTEVSVRCIPSSDQSKKLVPERDYEVSPIEYE
jgi:hypothetical protein